MNFKQSVYLVFMIGVVLCHVPAWGMDGNVSFWGFKENIDEEFKTDFFTNPEEWEKKFDKEFETPFFMNSKEWDEKHCGKKWKKHFKDPAQFRKKMEDIRVELKKQKEKKKQDQKKQQERNKKESKIKKEIEIVIDDSSSAPEMTKKAFIESVNPEYLKEIKKVSKMNDDQLFDVWLEEGVEGLDKLEQKFEKKSSENSEKKPESTNNGIGTLQTSQPTSFSISAPFMQQNGSGTNGCPLYNGAIIKNSEQLKQQLEQFPITSIAQETSALPDSSIIKNKIKELFHFCFTPNLTTTTCLLGGVTLLTFALSQTRAWNTNALLKAIGLTGSTKLVLPGILAAATTICGVYKLKLKNVIKNTRKFKDAIEKQKNQLTVPETTNRIENSKL
jgi:hypothetical protein